MFESCGHFGRVIVAMALALTFGTGCSSDKDLTHAQNNPPTIISVVAGQDTLALGEGTLITCRAVDEQFDLLSFTWMADEGTFGGSPRDSTAQWNPPAEFSGPVIVTVVANDGKENSAPATVSLYVAGETGSLSGKVTDRATGDPLASVLVSAGGRDTQTIADGSYLFSGLPAGPQLFSATLDGYVEFSRTVDIRKGENFQDASLTAAAAVGTVSGLVTNSLGDPLPAALCRIGERSVTTDENGMYSIDELLRESHILQVSRAGYLLSSESVDLNAPGVTVNVSLDASLPTPPASVTATRDGSLLRITWPPSAEDTVTKYQIYQRIDSGTTTEIPGAVVDATVREYTISGEANHRYGYRVSAINFEEEQSQVSQQSNVIVLTELSARVAVPGGPVIMGSTPASWTGVDWGTDSHPANAIEVGEYSIDATEVTNRQYQSFLYEVESTEEVTIDSDDNVVYQGTDKLFIFTASKLGVDPVTEEFTIVAGFEEHPVVGVTWFGAAAYASHYGLRLPTELEWEKAARGISTEWGTFPSTTVGYGTLYPWGTEDPSLERVNAGDRTTGTLSVTSLAAGAANHWAQPIYHLSGNAWEWCEDWLAAYDSPHVPPESGTFKVLRGGSWSEGDERLRTGARFSADPESSSPTTGFRCAKDTR